jgi:methionyl-tRNA synthetase
MQHVQVRGQEAADRKSVFYVTTPIYYVNSLPHIGHAYTTIAADVVARWQRLRGGEVVFATGTDEHGAKNAQVAEERGISPQEHVDAVAAAYQAEWEALGISYDCFIRTTDPQHMRTVQHVFRTLQEGGLIYRAPYEGWYCVADETFVAESDMVDGKCPNPECGRPLVRVSEESHFFRASAFAERLEALIGQGEDFIGPRARRNEVLGLLRGGLRDTCVSRATVPWGVPVPGEEGPTIYVWFDALVNYLTVAGYPDDVERFAAVWPPDLQLMGKEILPRFHGTVWPAMLMGLGLALPKCLYAHGWWTVEGQKMSKRLGNVVDPVVLAQSLAAKTGAEVGVAADAVRYFVMREIPFGADGDFSVQHLLGRFNADLANDLGNLLNRVMPQVVARFEGKVPEGVVEEAVGASRLRALGEMEGRLEALDFSGALSALWEHVRGLNKYLDTAAPWSRTAEHERRAVGAVFYNVLEELRAVATAVEPFMPTVASRLRESVGAPAESEGWEAAKALNRLASGRAVRKGGPLFPRVDLGKTMLSISKEESPVSGSATISMAQFQQMDLRVAEVVEAERVAGTDRLLRLVVSLGSEGRTVVAGIGDRYQPEALVGRQLVLLANLEPVTIRGIRSEGMILAVGEKAVEGLLTTDGQVTVGGKVR